MSARKPRRGLNARPFLAGHGQPRRSPRGWRRTERPPGAASPHLSGCGPVIRAGVEYEHHRGLVILLEQLIVGRVPRGDVPVDHAMSSPYCIAVAASSAVPRKHDRGRRASDHPGPLKRKATRCADSRSRPTPCVTSGSRASVVNSHFQPTPRPSNAQFQPTRRAWRSSLDFGCLGVGSEVPGRWRLGVGVSARRHGRATASILARPRRPRHCLLGS